MAGATREERYVGDFPDDFLWGVSSSAYQIEGATQVGGRGESIWDRFVTRPGAVVDGSTGAVATGHYERYREDVGLMRELGARVYRFSVSWPRWLPSGRGRPAPAGVDFYERLVDSLLAAGIEPWICLYHWDLPQALQDRGGWTSRDCADYFADYAAAVAGRLGDRVRTFLMLNEPNVHALLGHLTGQHAPGVSDLSAYLAAIHHQNLAVGKGIARLRALDAGFRLGSVVSLQPVLPAAEPGTEPREEDVAAASLADAAYNRASLDPLLLGRYPAAMAGFFEALLRAGDEETMRQRVDLLGVNHYTLQRVRLGRGPLGLELVPPGAGTEATQMGWRVAPEALTRTLLELKSAYGNPPVVITENGAAYEDPPVRNGTVDDASRVAYFARYIRGVAAALEAGCDVRGYLAWTLVENFEWGDGFTRRFGCVALDRETLERTPKASFHYLRRVFGSGALG